MERAIQVRLEKWHYFRRFVAIRARANFSLHLQNRGFSGSLHFDHNAQKLKLRVQTGDASQPYEKDPKSLSGGEKSFATICLLLALWEAIGCPIRCLDEFDVFMDAVNRKVSMDMIVRGAMRVILTPDQRRESVAGRAGASRLLWPLTPAVCAHHAAEHDERVARAVRARARPQLTAGTSRCTGCATQSGDREAGCLRRPAGGLARVCAHAAVTG